jgi:hypothetical protein
MLSLRRYSNLNYVCVFCLDANFAIQLAVLAAELDVFLIAESAANLGFSNFFWIFCGT